MQYEGFAIRCQGAGHIEKGTPCQDSVQYQQDLQTVTASVADGHGSSQYFRSERGSAFAADIACSKMAEFLHLSHLLEEEEC